MKIIVKKPGEVAQLVEIKDDSEIRSHVGGWLEMIPMFNRTQVPHGVVAFGDSESKLKGLAPNIVILEDVVCGPMVVANTDEAGETISLDDEELNGKLIDSLNNLSL